VFDELEKTKKGAGELVNATVGVMKLIDILVARPKYIFWIIVVIFVLGATVSARDTWLLLLGIGLFLWGFALRRAEVSNR
jgi:hypothetical protein